MSLFPLQELQPTIDSPSLKLRRFARARCGATISARSAFCSPGRAVLSLASTLEIPLLERTNRENPKP